MDSCKKNIKPREEMGRKQRHPNTKQENYNEDSLGVLICVLYWQKKHCPCLHLRRMWLGAAAAYLTGDLTSLTGRSQGRLITALRTTSRDFFLSQATRIHNSFWGAWLKCLYRLGLGHFLVPSVIQCISCKHFKFCFLKTELEKKSSILLEGTRGQILAWTHPCSETRGKPT